MKFESEDHHTIGCLSFRIKFVEEVNGLKGKDIWYVLFG